MLAPLAWREAARLGWRTCPTSARPRRAGGTEPPKPAEPAAAKHDYSNVLANPARGAGVAFDDLPGFTRSAYHRDHALITHESRVWTSLPNWCAGPMFEPSHGRMKNRPACPHAHGPPPRTAFPVRTITHAGRTC